MPAPYNGKAAGLLPLLPTAKNITSSTNTTPITVTTSTAHGMTTGDYVMINGHTVNTNANGSREVVVTGASTFQLVGSVGNGIGGATGTAHPQCFGSVYNQPANGDKPRAEVLNVPSEALGDRTALLRKLMNWDLHIYAGGGLTVHDNAVLTLQPLSTSLAFGSLTFAAGSETTFTGNSDLRFMSTSLVTFDDGSEITGTVKFKTGSQVNVFGILSLKDDSELNVFGSFILKEGAEAKLRCLLTVEDGVGDITMENNTTLTVSGGFVMTSASVVIDSATSVADASAIARTGYTVYDGNNAYRANRVATADVSSSHDIEPWKWDIIRLPHPGGNISLTMLAPPGNRRITTKFVRVGSWGDNEISLFSEPALLEALISEDTFFAVEVTYNPDLLRWEMTGREIYS